MNKTTWYTVVIAMECLLENEPEDQLFSEELVIISAASPNEAESKAQAKGISMNHTYLNENQQRVTWVFRSVLEVHKVIHDELKDGTEIYSRMLPQFGKAG